MILDAGCALNGSDESEPCLFLSMRWHRGAVVGEVGTTDYYLLIIVPMVDSDPYLLVSVDWYRVVLCIRICRGYARYFDCLLLTRCNEFEVQVALGYRYMTSLLQTGHTPHERITWDSLCTLLIP